ncbi:AraC family transcriptional regulator [Burkholderia gladioli]|uniref:AraC family transcriptional regulator n=1 Tax=Burkholderia gladioli TaxID=28095 RepID=UPI00163F48D7|nr:AraC family transcriptional regulator [Burkholderia gladioli]
MDPLSQTLALFKLETFVAGGFVIDDGVGLQSQSYEGLKCYMSVWGNCWIEVAGVEETVRIAPGECVILPRGWPICLTTDLSAPRVDFFASVSAQSQAGPVPRHLDSGCFLLGGQFRLRGELCEELLQALPPIVHVRNVAGRGIMRWSLEFLREELRCPQPGGFVVAQQLSHVLLLQALRLHLTETTGGTGWMFAFTDPQLKAAITAMHENPARSWTIQDLADLCYMSRTVFAQKFKAKVGMTSMDYLARWRMMLACDRLASTGEPVATIARSVGYETESTFGKAFKRTMGRSPHAFRHKKTALVES